MNQHHTEIPEPDSKYHTYQTHYIPWYVRLMWLGFWVGLIWYIIKYAIPAAKNFF